MPRERLALAVLLSALLHAVLAVLLGSSPPPPSALWLPELRPVTVVDVPGASRPRDHVLDPTPIALATMTAFRKAANLRVAAMERELTAEIVRRAQAARAEADALAAEVARSQAERVRLAEQAGELEQTLASREADLAAAQARAAEAERIATQARLQANEAAVWKAAYDDLERTFRREIAAREVALQRLTQGVSLSISDRVLFASGVADILADGERILDRVAGVLMKMGEQRARIEGHTDDVPIGPALRLRYLSNWELSTARATAVVRYLVARSVNPERLAAAGYADTRPVAPNTSEEGRAQNRRIEIILVPSPGPAKPPPGQGT